MNLRNLYIQVVTKVIKESEENIEIGLLSYLSKEEIKEKTSKMTEEEVKVFKEELRQDFIRRTTVHKTQMLRIRKNPALDSFVRANVEKITTMGQGLILKEADFIDLCERAKLNPNLEVIDILYDSETVYVKIIKLTRENVAMALAQKSITPERFDELMNILDKDENPET